MFAILAGVAFGAAMALLLTFFVTGSRRADRWSNVAFLVFYALAAVVVYEVHVRYVGRTALVWVPTAVALGSLAVLFVTQALVLAAVIDFRRVAIPQTVGFALYALWILSASALILAFGGLPAVAGWLGVAAVAATLGVLAWFARDPAVIRGEREPSRSQSAIGVLPLAAICAWLIVLGISG